MVLLQRRSYKYDSLDLKIIQILQEDGRKPFAEIGRALNVPARIVQARYSKMKQAGLIIGSAIFIDQSKIGITRHSIIGVEAHESEVEDVKKHIDNLKVKNVLIYSWLSFGRYNIWVGVYPKNNEDVFKVKNLIKLHPGVVNLDVSLSSDFNWNYRWDYKRLNIERILE